MSRRTFYEHFEDLSDALIQVYEFGANFVLDKVERHTRAVKHPMAKLETGIAAYLSTLSHNAQLARVVYREIRAAGPQHAVRHELTLMRFVMLISEGVLQAKTQGLASRDPDEQTVFALVAGIEATAMRYIDHGQEELMLEAVPALCELVFRAFR